jgi:hypothetical protein
MTSEMRRCLELITGCPDGVTGVVLAQHGFTAEVVEALLRAELVVLRAGSRTRSGETIVRVYRKRSES